MLDFGTEIATISYMISSCCLVSGVCVRCPCVLGVLAKISVSLCKARCHNISKKPSRYPKDTSESFIEYQRNFFLFQISKLAAKYSMSEIRNILDFSSQCFIIIYHIWDIVLDFQNAFWICYDASPMTNIPFPPNTWMFGMPTRGGLGALGFGLGSPQLCRA